MSWNGNLHVFKKTSTVHVISPYSLSILYECPNQFAVIDIDVQVGREVFVVYPTFLIAMTLPSTAFDVYLRLTSSL